MADNTAKRYLDLEGLKTFYDLLVGKFADKSELVTLKNSVGGLTTRVSNVETKASANASAIEEVKGALDDKVCSSDLSALDERVQTIEGSVSSLKEVIGDEESGLVKKVAELEANSAGTISMTTTQSLGGIPVGTVYDNASIAKVLEDLLAPYVAFKGLTISAKYDSFTISPITYKEKGETVKINKLYASWTQGSRDIKNVSIYEGSVSLDSYKNGTAPSSALLAEFNSSESNKIASPVEKSIDEVVLNSGESKTFTVFVRDTDDLNGVTVEKATVTITNKAYIPVFYGVLPKSAYPFQVENITGLRKAQTLSTTVNFGNVSADSYIVVATQKPLKSAIDKSNLENIDLFDSEDMVLSTSLWSDETFHVYRTYTKTQLDNWTFKFTV